MFQVQPHILLVWFFPLNGMFNMVLRKVTFALDFVYQHRQYQGKPLRTVRAPAGSILAAHVVFGPLPFFVQQCGGYHATLHVDCVGC